MAHVRYLPNGRQQVLAVGEPVALEITNSVLQSGESPLRSGTYDTVPDPVPPGGGMTMGPSSRPPLGTSPLAAPTTPPPAPLPAPAASLGEAKRAGAQAGMTTRFLEEFDRELSGRTSKLVDYKVHAEAMLAQAVRSMLEWMKGYRDRQIDFADATLVWLAGARNTDLIITTDYRDFRTYRLPNRRSFRLLLPEA